MSKDEPFVRVNKAHPCPVCGKGDWCTVAKDGGACVCMRVDAGAKRECKNGGHLHVLRETPMPKTAPKKAVKDWRPEAQAYAQALPPEVKSLLAKRLGLPPGGLDCFPLLGRHHVRPDRKFFTFPEFDAAGRVIGLSTRYRDGFKGFVEGGLRGLSVPHGFDPAQADRVYVVEGPTDTASLWCAGLPVVGRPSNSGGADHLGAFLFACPPRCRIVVVGENDRKADGDWPGLHGAAGVAERLALSLLRRPACEREPVRWAVCPDGVKDVRAWLTGRPADEAWAERGRELARKLDAVAVEAETAEKTLRKLAAENVTLRAERDELRRRMEAVERAMQQLAGKK